MGGLLVGFLEECSEVGLSPLGEIVEHILPLVPLAPLDEGVAPEGLLSFLFDPFAPIHHTEEPFLYSQSSLKESVEKLFTD